MSDSTEEQSLRALIKVEAVGQAVMSEEEADANTEPRPSTTTSNRPKPTTDTKKKRKKGKWKPTHPNSTMMCIEAIQSLKEGKGSSAQAIKKYILATYTTVRPDMVNYMVRTALTNGIQTGAFARPKGDESSGAHGRFKVGKMADMPTKTTYKPSSHKKASSNKK
ncbi:sperm-specific protein PHI-2B-like, partial [Anneissia japonica]|uniref:sperm-specific protein PHI-2B-like n=1 Tax=Anneissia japonica TaxID=1529436 RepID=UPI001425626B